MIKTLASLEKHELEIISQAERSINQDRNEKIALVAYESQD